MQTIKNKEVLTGKYIQHNFQDQNFQCFIPNDLPLNLSQGVLADLEKLERDILLSIGSLKCLPFFIPDTDLFIALLMRKDAILYSQQKGKQITLSNFFEYENDEISEATQLAKYNKEDVQDIKNYIEALMLGINQLNNPNRPFITIYLIQKLQKTLVKNIGSNTDPTPGKFRSQPVHIGGTNFSNASYVPHPGNTIDNNLNDLMANLVNYINDDDIDPILKAGVAHAQFELIHPFNNGNGRLGRLLILLILCKYQIIEYPISFINLFFTTNRDEYEKCLSKISQEGNWEDWLKFYFKALKESSGQALKLARQIKQLQEDSRKIIAQSTSPKTFPLLENLFKNPYITVTTAMTNLAVKRPTAQKAIDSLVQSKILDEVENEKPKKYRFSKYLDILDES